MNKKEIFIGITATAIIGTVVIFLMVAVIGGAGKLVQKDREDASLHNLCSDTCQKVATRKVATENGSYNYTEPVASSLSDDGKYRFCTCIFQGNNRNFVFDAKLKMLQDAGMLEDVELIR